MVVYWLKIISRQAMWPSGPGEVKPGSRLEGLIKGPRLAMSRQRQATRACASLLLPLLAIAAAPTAHAAFVSAFRGGVATGLRSPQLTCAGRPAPGSRGLLRATPPRTTSLTKHWRGGARALEAKDGPGGDGDEEGKMWFERIFDPLVEKFAGLPDEEQKAVATVYQVLPQRSVDHS